MSPDFEKLRESKAAMIAAAHAGEAPLSGVLALFAKLTYTERRLAGKFAKAVVEAVGMRKQIGERMYRSAKEHHMLAVFSY